MPELPEVEVSCRGIAPHLQNQTITAVTVRDARLRWPIPETIQNLVGATISAVERRAKYIVVTTSRGYLLIHLGMSGSLRVLPHDALVVKHDHVDLRLGNGQLLRFNDPRRFGALLWQARGQVHPLLADLGPEPLSADFSGEHLFRLSRGRAALSRCCASPPPPRAR